MAGRIRSLQSPGVEITETDKSQIAPSISGTYVLIPGFADRGEDYAINTGNSVDQFISNYGQPTNEAERYFYHAMKDVVQEGATAITVKIPYENNLCTKYKAVTLTLDSSAVAISGDISHLSNGSNAVSAFHDVYDTPASVYASANLHIDSFREMTMESIELTTNEYDILSQSDGLLETAAVTAVATSDFTIVDISKNILAFKNFNNDLDKTCEGMFVSVVDYASAAYAQRLTKINSTNPDLDVMDMVKSIKFTPKSGVSTFGSEQTISESRILSKLYDKYMYSSFSEDLMRKFPTIDVISPVREEGVDSASLLQASTEYVSFVTVVVGRVRTDLTSNNGQLIPEILATYFGSLDENSKDNATGQSNYICNVINSSSPYIRMYDNKSGELVNNKRISTVTRGSKLQGVLSANACIPFLNTAGSINTNTTVNGKLKLIGFDPQYDVEKVITTNGIMTSLDKVFAKVGNIDEIQIDIVLDAGLTNIAEFVSDGAADYSS